MVKNLIELKFNFDIYMCMYPLVRDSAKDKETLLLLQIHLGLDLLKGWEEKPI